MKLSECWRGRVVKIGDLAYDEAIEKLAFGHIDSFDYHIKDDEVYVTIKRIDIRNEGWRYENYLPSELYPLED